MSNQLGAQFANTQYSGGDVAFNFLRTVLTPNTRNPLVQPGALRLGQTLYVVIRATNACTSAKQLWIMPWWLHPTFEFRYPGQGVYTASDLANFGPQNPLFTRQDSLWMMSPKRFDIPGAPSPAGACISDMQADVWAIDIPAGGSVKKSFFYPSHGYGLAQTSQVRDDGIPMDGMIQFAVSVTPGASHAVFQDGQG
jgi:hypothetical protein